jgi:adenosylhomocysteine nucleosidase
MVPGATHYFCMTVVTFALPQESGDFRQVLRAAGGRLGGEEIRVAHLGVGPAAASREVRRLLAEEPPRILICTGFAGGLDARVRIGDLVVADNFSAPELRARAQALTGEKPHRFFGSVVTRDEVVETAAAKAALAFETGALAVDMETASVAEACHAAGVPLLAVRAISDDVTTPLPVPFDEWFDLRRQRPRPWALVKYLLRHPESIRPFTHFVRGLAPARQAMADFLDRYLRQPLESNSSRRMKESGSPFPSASPSPSPSSSSS